MNRRFFQVECNGQDENLESFDDGYYLFTFARNRQSRDEPCKVVVSQPGFESNEFEFSVLTSRVKNAGEFVVRKYDETAKKPFRVRVVDAEGNPISGAEVRLHTRFSRSRSSSDFPSVNTDSDGTAEIVVYPANYSYTVAAKGFTHAQGNIELSAAEDAPQEQVTLYPALQGTVRVAWTSTSAQGGNRDDFGRDHVGDPARPT